ncbi:anti-sigma factor [Streptomyces sp. NPDC058412]|uniref:anti-sigma factor n=1 Tax=Streptomyces sp. NPDC058412 TaxID=3346486 RepID=UPI0036653733
MTAPDARTVHGRTTSGADTTSAQHNQAVFTSSGLPVPPTGKTYQLWFDDHGTKRPAGLVHHDGALLMHGNPYYAHSAGLTLEPTGGSPQPTTTPASYTSPSPPRPSPEDHPPEAAISSQAA